MSAMKLISRVVPVVLIGLTLLEQIKSEGVANDMVVLQDLLNGDLSNQAQRDGGYPGLDLLQVRVLNVDIPDLRPDVAFYIEEAVNGKLQFMQIGILTIGKDDVLYLTRYNFTDHTIYRPFQFNISELVNLKRSQLYNSTNCVSTWERLDKCAFSGLWPACHHTINGEHPTYGLTYTCNYITAAIPFFVNERHTFLPLKVKRLNGRYPIVNRPKDYVSPCDD